MRPTKENADTARARLHTVLRRFEERNVTFCHGELLRVYAFLDSLRRALPTSAEWKVAEAKRKAAKRAAKDAKAAGETTPATASPVRFTAAQYDEAIRNLQDAKQQLEPDAHPCSICSDSGHMAYECGRNPLVAMRLCRQITEQSRELHDTLHVLSGYCAHMGEPFGPAIVVPPTGDVEADDQSHATG